MKYGAERKYHLKGQEIRAFRKHFEKPKGLSRNDGEVLVLRAKATEFLRKKFPAGDYFRFLRKTLVVQVQPDLSLLDRRQLEVIVTTLEGGWDEI